MPGFALPFRVGVEYPKAPECASFAEKSRSVIEEWYPKINEILFAPEHPLQTGSITLVCEPMKGVAWTDIDKNRIHISSAFAAAHPEDFGTVVHELTHIVQHYAKLKREGVWLQEGIADYIRHQYYERDMDSLAAQELIHHTFDPDHDNYRKGYRVAAAFFFWVEKQKKPTIIQDLNRGCADGRCTGDLFVGLCGKDVDTLWAEFVGELKSNTRPAS
jgi:hypothetical protein